jgi:hypothetical protein
MIIPHDSTQLQRRTLTEVAIPRRRGTYTEEPRDPRLSSTTTSYTSDAPVRELSIDTQIMEIRSGLAKIQRGNPGANHTRRCSTTMWNFYLEASQPELRHLRDTPFT